MSTKIYTGFVVKHNKPYLLMKHLKEFQSYCLNYARKIVSSALPTEFVDNEESNKIINKIYQERAMADVVIYFKKNKILGQYFIHDKHLEKKFRSQPWFKEYHYQNQTNPDERVSAKEWKQREKDWNFLHLPANDGFSFYLVNPREIQLFWIICWRNDHRRE